MKKSIFWFVVSLLLFVLAQFNFFSWHKQIGLDSVLMLFALLTIFQAQDSLKKERNDYE